MDCVSLLRVVTEKGWKDMSSPLVPIVREIIKRSELQVSLCTQKKSKVERLREKKTFQKMTNGEGN